MSINVLGSGQLAKAFSDLEEKGLFVFASGVSNSTCTDPDEFKRESDLLLNALRTNSKRKFVYFSSCALSAKDYELNSYYKHKLYMERLVQENSSAYYIFRLPQLFGDLILHQTLINYIYKSIVKGELFSVFDEAHRYVIEISDVRLLVDAYLKHHESGIIVDIANPFRYKILDIVKAFERLLNKKANYQLIEKNDQYTLNLSPMLSFMEQYNIETEFGPDYLIQKLSQRIIRVK